MSYRPVLLLLRVALGEPTPGALRHETDPDDAVKHLDGGKRQAEPEVLTVAAGRGNMVASRVFS
jgi:hypothetical protein